MDNITFICYILIAVDYRTISFICSLAWNCGFNSVVGLVPIPGNIQNCLNLKQHEYINGQVMCLLPFALI